MFIKNLTKRERYGALAALAILSIALVYNFLLEPLYSRWRDLSDEIGSKLNMLKKDSKMVSMHQTQEADYAKFAAYLKSQKSEEEGMADVLTYIENLARNDSCLIINIKPIGKKKAGPYSEMLIDITAEATMANFSKFLYDIENTKNMILKVKRFTIASKSGQASALKGTFLIGKMLVD